MSAKSYCVPFFHLMRNDMHTQVNIQNRYLKYLFVFQNVFLLYK